MANNPESLFHRALPTAHRRLLDTIIRRELPRLTGDVLVLGAGLHDNSYLLQQAKTIIRTDVEAYPGIDRVADAQRLPLPNESYDTIVAIEVFEHIRLPSKAAGEVHRVLKKGGVAVISIPFLFRIHGDPMDFTRLTEQGLRLLFSDFRTIEVSGFGNRIHVISDLITTWYKPLAALRFANHLLAAPFLNHPSSDAPSGYWLRLTK